MEPLLNASKRQDQVRCAALAIPSKPTARPDLWEILYSLSFHVYLAVMPFLRTVCLHHLIRPSAIRLGRLRNSVVISPCLSQQTTRWVMWLVIGR